MRSLLTCFSLLLVLALTGLGHAAIVDVGVARDATVIEGTPSTNSGSKTNLYVASANGGTYQDERAWFAFDLTKQLPAGAVISSAKLRLYVYKADSSNDLPVAVHGSGTAWTESGLTWSNQPAYDTTPLSSVTLKKGEEGKWVEFDVTSQVLAHYGTDNAVNLLLKAATEGASTWVSYSFDSREYSSVLAPRLRIEYTGSWPTTQGVTIFHMNDAHSRVTPHELDIPGHNNNATNFQLVGGAPHFTGKLLSMKAAVPDSLVLDAGDVSEGNPLGDLNDERGMIDFYNLLDSKLKALPGGRGIDAAVIGNHDVRSMASLNNLKNLPTYPVISMNLVYKGTTTPFTKAYQIVTVNGKKIGILGFTHDNEQPGPDAAGTVEILKAAWEPRDSSTISIKEYVNTLRTVEGCDMVVLLSHVGHTRMVAGSGCTSSGVCDSYPLLEDSGGVRPPEVVVSGHWHTWTDTAWQPAHLNYKTLFVEAASYLEYLGQLDLTVDGRFKSAAVYPIINSQITPDADVTALVNNLKAEYAASNPVHGLDDIIGYSAVDLRLDKGKWWSMDEYPWNGNNTSGSWISDSMQWKASSLGYPTDLALQSGGGVRRDVPKGPVTYLQIYETYPWQSDSMAYLQMTGQQIWDYLQAKNNGAAISKGWLVTAQNGIITSITYNGTEISKSATYNVAISSYMKEHETPFTTLTATTINYSIREAVIDYTGQFTQANPMTVPMPRYNLDTELAGGFRAVVTMVDDSETQPYFQSAYVRLLGATDETVARMQSYLNGEAGHEKSYGLPGLVNADGSINRSHRLSEGMLYRSQLAFPVGRLVPGDIIELWAEASGYQGTPEFIDQEGIQADGTEFKILGHDETLARPEYHSSIASFLNTDHISHYVTFYATKTGTSSVRDAAGTQISTIYKPGGYYSMTLPGNAGDVLQITGVATYDEDHYVFRASSVTVSSYAGSGYPPVATIDPVVAQQNSSPLTLTSTASAVSTNGTATKSIQPVADAQVVEGYPSSNYGTKTYLYVQSAGSGSYLDERAWLKFDIASLLPSGATLTSAKLKMYAWKAGSVAMNASVHGGTSDSWTETGVTWNSQPAFGTALATTTLAAGSIGVWYNWDVTGHLQEKLSAGATSLSLMVKPETEGAATAQTWGFESKEYSSGQPVLEIEYTSAPVAATVTSVAYFYRYSTDNSSWGSWQQFDQSSSAPWTVSFNYPQGGGYYEFYSIATDSNNNVQPAPALAQVSLQYLPTQNGVCGTANGQTLDAAPVSGLCTVGIASTPTGIGPWNWTCSGLNGGSTATCSAASSASSSAEPVPALELWSSIMAVAGLFGIIMRRRMIRSA